MKDKLWIAEWTDCEGGVTTFYYRSEPTVERVYNALKKEEYLSDDESIDDVDIDIVSDYFEPEEGEE